MLSVGNSIFYRPKGKQVHADAARMRFHEGNVGDHIALLRVYNDWKTCDDGSDWCFEHYVQLKSMKRARDIRDQLKGLLERVEIEVASSLNDLEAIKKAITAGFFPHTAKLQKNGSYRTIKHPQTVHLHPSSSLAQIELLPRWVVYRELVLTTKEYMRQATELKPEWLVEIAPHYYQMKDVEDSSTKKMPKGKAEYLEHRFYKDLHKCRITKNFECTGNFYLHVKENEVCNYLIISLRHVIFQGYSRLQTVTGNVIGGGRTYGSVEDNDSALNSFSSVGSDVQHLKGAILFDV